MSKNDFSRAYLRIAALVVFVLILGQPLHAQIGLFKNYFVTGDFASGGIGLRGQGTLDAATGRYLSTGTITIPPCPPGGPTLSCVPASVQADMLLHPTGDIIAAFLYWESIEKTTLPTSAVGYVTNNIGVDNDPNHSPDCTIAGGTRCVIVGKPIGNPNASPCWSGGGSTGASNGGNSLRVYRSDVLRFLGTDPVTKKKVPSLQVWLSDSGSNGGGGTPLTEGASLVVVYRDTTMAYKGVVLMDGTFTLNNATDVMTVNINQFYQAATDAAKVNAKISYMAGDGQSNFPERLWFGTTGTALTQIANNPFTGTSGYSWDNLTYDVSSLVSPGAQSVTTTLDHAQGAFDCISFGAIASSFTVQDTDADGLLDVWETQGFKDPATGAVLVDLPAMGANPNHKDLFVEIDYMQDTNPGTAHTEKPKREALDLVGDAFKGAPVGNPDNTNGINVHFDLGACPYKDASNNCIADAYVIASTQNVNANAKGGDAIDERNPSFYCTVYSPTTCILPNEPGLVFWKQGLAHVKKNYEDPNRRKLFHYVLFGHTLVVLNPDGSASASTNSGRADLLGGDITVTLGKWKTRTQIVEAGTLMHELGHNLGLYHGGATADAANCTPNHVSSINYLYQNAGVFLPNGKPVVDFSRQVLPVPAGTENSLTEATGLGFGAMAYRMRWYAPIVNVASLLGVPAASLKVPRTHCDGTPFAAGEVPTLTRVDGFNALGTNIDWNYNGTATDTPQQDIDFDGIIENGNFAQHFAGVNDWDAIVAKHGLQQVGEGRALFGLSLGATFGDLVQSQTGEVELGEVELGEVELGEVELGEVELGEVELGEVELGEVELGEVELGAADEIDEPGAIDIGMNQVPTGLTAAVVKSRGVLSIVLNWTAPSPLPKDANGNDLPVAQYRIYRSNGAQVAPPFTQVPGTAATTATDSTVGNNNQYTYFVIAVYADSSPSGPSTPVTIIAK